MSRISIMQGRLGPPEDGLFQSFPRKGWRSEFQRAAAAGLDAIEWIDDTVGEGVNPLGSDEGISEMRLLASQHGVGVFSVCADYFMDRPFVRVTHAERARSVERLRWLLQQCHKAAITRIVLPFVDRSRIEGPDDFEIVVELLHKVLPEAARAEVELHLETSLAPLSFAELLGRLPHPYLKVNYDSGNSACLGYQPLEEFAAYGKRVGSVHIKDRVRGGGTVPLGTGDANLAEVFGGLFELGFRGDYVLQVARDEPGREVDSARENRAFVARQLASHAAAGRQADQ